VTPSIDNLPDVLESLKRLVAVERAARIDAEAKAASAAAAAGWAPVNVSSAEALIAHLKLAIETLRREAMPQHVLKSFHVAHLSSICAPEL
jgi:hypothetical protein